MAGRNKKNVTPPLSLSERLASAASKAPPTPPKTGKKERSTLQIPDEKQDLFNDFFATQKVFKDVEGKEKALKAMVRPFLANEHLKLWLNYGSKPENPRVVTDKGSCLIQAVDKSGKFKVPVDETGNPRNFQEYLIALGVPLTIVAKILAEVTRSAVYEITSPTKLEETNPKLGEKLVGIILDSGKFTASEIKELVTAREEVTLKDGFLGRLAGYCEGKAAVMDLLITATKAVEYRISGVNYDGDLADAYDHVQHSRTKEESTDIVTSDKVYQLVASGKTAQIYFFNGKNRELVCEKICKDNGHSLNTVNKWNRDRNYLETCIQEYRGST